MLKHCDDGPNSLSDQHCYPCIIILLSTLLSATSTMWTSLTFVSRCWYMFLTLAHSSLEFAVAKWPALYGSLCNGPSPNAAYGSVVWLLWLSMSTSVCHQGLTWATSGLAAGGLAASWRTCGWVGGLPCCWPGGWALINAERRPKNVISSSILCTFHESGVTTKFFVAA